MNNISFIGQNSHQGGVLAAKLMNLLIDDASHILIVRRKRKVNNHNAIENRVKGFLKFFEELNPNKLIHQIKINENSENENHNLTKTLLKNHLIKGIFVPSSIVNIVASYIKEFDLKDIKLIGYDLNSYSAEYIKDDIIDFLITQKPYDQGYKGVKVLADYLLLDKKPKTIYYSPIEIVTKENIDFYM